MKYSKVLSVAIVALFCLTAAAAIMTSDDSSAADVSEHNIYVEVVDNAQGAVSKSIWILVKCENTTDAFIAEANRVAASMDFPLVFAMSGDNLGVQYDGSGNNACWYAKDGAWAVSSKPAEDYVANNATIGFAVKTGWIGSAAYDLLTDAQKAKWQEDAMMPGYYMKKVDVKVTDVPEKKTYHVLGKVIKDDLSVETSKWVEFENYKTIDGFAAGANKAFADAGMDKVKFVGSWATYDGSENNTSVTVKDGKWAYSDNPVADYVTDEAVAFAFQNGYITTEKYNSLSDDGKKEWNSTGWADPYAYRWNFTDPIDGYKSANNNMILYIAIGVVAVIAVAAIVFFVIKRK